MRGIGAWPSIAVVNSGRHDTDNSAIGLSYSTPKSTAVVTVTRSDGSTRVCTLVPLPKGADSAGKTVVAFGDKKWTISDEDWQWCQEAMDDR